MFIATMVFTKQDKDEIITLLADQLNDFKNKVIEEVKSNIFELMKKDIKKSCERRVEESGEIKLNSCFTANTC